jgi:galactose mutarotase-like enzyme
MKVVDLGPSVVSVSCPSVSSPEGEEITLCKEDAATLATRALNPFYGSTVGRYANRIGKGEFTVDGTKHAVARNFKGQHSHGGVVDWSLAVWRVLDFGVRRGGTDAYVLFYHVSPDGDEGFPGEVHAFACYSLSADSVVGMSFEAHTSRATPLNMCNHVYWTLAAGHSDVRDHTLAVCAAKYVEVDADSQIPTGKLPCLADAPAFDFRLRPVADATFDGAASTASAYTGVVGRRIGDHLLDVTGGGQVGFDHSFIIAKDDSVAEGCAGAEAYPALQALQAEASTLAARYAVLPSSTVPSVSKPPTEALPSSEAFAESLRGDRARGAGADSASEDDDLFAAVRAGLPGGDTSPPGRASDAGAAAGAASVPVVPRYAGPTAASIVLRPAAILADPASGRRMTVFTTQPCVHVYTANFMRGEPPFAQHYAACLETQFPPDSPNQPLCGSCILRPGQTYYHVTLHKLEWE